MVKMFSIITNTTYIFYALLKKQLLRLHLVLLPSFGKTVFPELFDIFVFFFCPLSVICFPLFVDQQTFFALCLSFVESAGCFGYFTLGTSSMVVLLFCLHQVFTTFSFLSVSLCHVHHHVVQWFPCYRYLFFYDLIERIEW